jgi:ComEC/Rec2-related protein
MPSILFAAIGTLIGSIIFVLGDFRVLLTAIICFIVSSVAYTTLSNYRQQILSLLTFLLIVFFNYNLRAESLEYFNWQHYFNQHPEAKAIVKFKIQSNYYFQDKLIVEFKAGRSFWQQLFLPLRASLQVSSLAGITVGDELKSENKWSFKPLAKARKNYKTYITLQNKQVDFINHRRILSQELRNKVINYYDGQLTAEHSSIVKSLVLGSRVAKLPQDLKLAVKKLGLNHFFAASGFHLTVLVGFLALIFKYLRQRKTFTNLILIFISFVYSALAGFSPSIIRALIGITAILGFELVGRKSHSLKILIISAGLILLLDPYSIFDLGFQFSYLATFALMLWASPVQESLLKIFFNENSATDIKEVAVTQAENYELSKVQSATENSSSQSNNLITVSCDIENESAKPKIINNNESACTQNLKKPNLIIKTFTSMSKYSLEIIAVSLAVQIFLAPLILYYFQVMPVWSLLANLILSPLLALTITLAFCGLTFILPPLLYLAKFLLLKLSSLPYQTLNLEIDFFTFIVFILLTNLIAFELCKDKLKFDNPFSHHAKTYYELCISFIKNCFWRRSLIYILSVLLIANIAPLYKTTALCLKYGKAQGLIAEFISKHQHETYAYGDLAGLQALVINDLNSFTKLAGLFKELKQVNVLILPHLRKNDLKLDQLLDKIKPQFIFGLTASKKPLYNIELAKGKANFILNEGSIMLYDNRFWNYK